MYAIRSYYVQGSFLPFINKTDDENAEEQHHGDEAKQADILEHHGPWKEKGDFEIENDEEDRHQVIPHIELHARVFKGLETAFIRRELFA